MALIITFILIYLHVYGNTTVLTPCLQRTAGSSSDGTADSDDSGDHEKTDSSHSEANQRNNTRMTRASLRLSQSSQGINTQLIQCFLTACVSTYTRSDYKYQLSNTLQKFFTLGVFTLSRFGSINRHSKSPRSSWNARLPDAAN